jgi:NADH-quinone oxidoreductase subunit G
MEEVKPAKKILNCTINGVALQVEEGTSIIEAMNRHAQSIAHYCWHPGLSVAGVCRMCMVEIAGNPRVQIACNTQVTEGMVVNNTSDKVKDAVKWGLDFHLINHPLDCPICDQAGECGLQDQYMQYGKYDPEMSEAKTKKHKAIPLGPKVMLDSERCILCSRCVRFTDEVTKTNELGIFNRGDHSEIGTFDNKPLDNNYSVNTVDICPVGALTSRDFRFRQRVWFLKEHETICNSCSTGCNVKISYNKEGVFRVKPRFNEEVNGHWMCDEGREIYKHLNKEYRLLDAQINKQGQTEYLTPALAAKKIGQNLRGAAASSVALVVTGQHSQEELQAILHFFKNELGTSHIYHWLNNPENIEDFDGLLLRGDRNPNTKGLRQILEKLNIKTEWSALSKALQSGEVQTVVVAGPENQAVYPDLGAKLTELSKAKNLVWLSACRNETLEKSPELTLIPLKTFFEKDGTYVNYKGLSQFVKAGAVTVPHALSLNQIAAVFAGREASESSTDATVKPLPAIRLRNESVTRRGVL